MSKRGMGGRNKKRPFLGMKRSKNKDIDFDPSTPTKVPVNMKKGGSVGGKKKPIGMKKGGKFPDLNKDGKVSQADVLKGRGVPGFYGGGMATKGGAKGGARGGKRPMGMMKGGAVGGKKKGPKGYAKGGKVRGAGIARKGVRPCKMR